jgi:dolichol-phosphate mannosyltransferase
MNDCIVIIPTYNEIENIESIIRSVLSQHKPFHILIVDDNSDHTADRVRLLQTEFGGRLFWKIEKRSGFGTAYVQFKWALENKYDFILKWMLIFLIIQMT